MKMSLCNTFRLFVVSLIIVLSSIDTPAAFTLRRIAGEPGDLAQESVLVDVKHEIKGSANVADFKNNDNLKLNTAETTPGPSNGTRELNRNDSDGSDKVGNSDNVQNPAIESQVSSSNSIHVAQANDTKTTVEPPTTSVVQNVTIEETTKVPDTLTNNELKITTNTRKIEFIEHETSTAITESTLKLDESEITTVYESAKLPTWKKYTTIDRKRQPTPLTDDNTIPVNKTEEMIKAETKQSRSSLKDTVTSDIPSLEQLKNDLLHSTLKEFVSEVGTLSIFTTDIETSTGVVPTSTKWDTFESKRAGYLDLSEKVTNGQTSSVEQASAFKINSKETIRAMFEAENIETDIPEEKNHNRAESQSQLNEDSIKEELLKEKLINENDENAQRFDTKTPPLPETQTSNSTVINSSNELSVKPISGDKIKNTSLYAVNPNYKPLKKIEVQAPKQFVRDPDDNSWRNESLSSLGIVFKPKNSSKPFTQVLKNKTETEWNSLSEKDSKNDIPDLKERLHKMAEKRKSKRKKTDSLGNIVYFDYEENSSSVEHIPTDQPTSSITTSAESSTTISDISSTSEGTSEFTPTLTPTAEKPRGKIRNPYSTKKFRKFFNVPEYYDTTDEDDTDYLNMAKIDIKKFSTSSKTIPTTTPPVTQRPWSINKSPFTISPERKGTVQYFPPRTTQKVNINDYDNDFKLKVNSYTTNTDPPKNVLPVSEDNPTTPVNPIQYTLQNDERLNAFVITSKPDIAKTFYPTQPPQTTRTEVTLVSEDGPFDRDAYVIRHYKDFINQAAKDHEFDKNMDYVPYTEAPRDVTKSNLITYVTEKPKPSMDNEYDYETQFRKDVLQRFVDNFNQNSERFKSDFPVLFNSSVIHRDTESGREIASSRAFMRGLYNTDIKAKTPHREAYDPNNENMTVELSPSYELHYYVPEQEEKEEVVPQPVTLPYQYRL